MKIFPQFKKKQRILLQLSDNTFIHFFIQSHDLSVESWVISSCSLVVKLNSRTEATLWIQMDSNLLTEL